MILSKLSKKVIREHLLIESFISFEKLEQDSAIQNLIGISSLKLIGEKSTKSDEQATNTKLISERQS
ncbi:hypothetical protein DA097_10730 [Vibrio rotiferianus]|nr:hypothetical protein DA097_10730 [Vibrio rotiferianus]